MATECSSSEVVTEIQTRSYVVCYLQLCHHFLMGITAN